jgi:undecaprenyl-diphosphatase
MSILQAIIYGIIQGVTEFLPVSSTAHITLLPWLFGWKDPGAVFDVALHLGTAAAVILFFLKDWLKLIKSGFTDPRSTDGRLLWFVAAATIPGAIAGVLLDKFMEGFRNPALIGIMLISMGIILYVSDRLAKKDVILEQIGLKRSISIGIAQVFAVIPGVSRSGITMSVGRMLGLTRESIAKFTFLMSAPIILGDALYHAKDIGSIQVQAAPFAAAVLTSAVVGILSIKLLLEYLRKKGFALFAVYRCVLGVSIILLYFVK